MWKAHHSQIGMQVALLSYGWSKRYEESTCRSPNATQLQLLQLSICRKMLMLMKHSPSMTGRNRSNHDCNLLKLYNKLCILKVNLTLFLTGQFGIILFLLLFCFLHECTSITVYWLLMINLLKFASLIKMCGCLVKCDIVQTKYSAGVWRNVTLSRQNVLALSKSYREHCT